MGRGLTTQDLGRPNVALARKQHRAYVEALESAGVRITVLGGIPELSDSHFVEDTAVLHQSSAILTSPGVPERRAEVERIRPVLAERMSVRDLGSVQGARLDGGDVLVADNLALIGIGERTNRLGAECLRQRLIETDPTLRVEMVPFRGLLHFKSGITAIAPSVFVGDPHIQLGVDLPGVKINWLPPEEGYGANVLPINDAVLVSASSPAVREMVQRRGGTAVPLDLSEFRKMDGALTCLSLLW